MALLQELQSNVTDPESALRVVSAEPLLLLLAGSTVVLLFVLVIPLLEELIKAAGPAIAISRRIRTSAAPTKSEVIMWGLAAGAGFAFTENVLNTQGVLTGGDGLGGLWAGAMLLRVGTTCMHMVTTGTVAVGWYYALVERRRSRMLLLLAAATVAHAVWNTAAIALGGIAVMTTANPDLGFVAGCLAILALFLLFGLFAAFVYWLVRLIRWAQPPPVEIITSSGRYLEIKG
jgi:RsiW-degrading membrane proteinase PrsW (M82 family)